MSSTTPFIQQAKHPLTALTWASPRRDLRHLITPPMILPQLGQEKNLIGKTLKKRVALLLLALIATLPRTEELAMAIEEPSYSVIESADHFEIRSYEPSVVAQIKTSGHFESAGNAGFRVLADYIFGNNDQKIKIAMTAPVKMTRHPEPSASSPPEYEVEFVMPQEMKREDLPHPQNRAIELKTLPKKLMAVLKYSGTWSEERFNEHKDILIKEIKSHGYEALSEPIFARYNPPFIPWFLRRNEIWIEVKKIKSIQELEKTP